MSSQHHYHSYAKLFDAHRHIFDLTTMSTNQTSDEARAVFQQALKSAAVFANTTNHLLGRLREVIEGVQLGEDVAGDIEVLQGAMTAQLDAIQEVVKALEGALNNPAVSEFLEIRKKASELMEASYKTEAAAEKFLASIQDIIANLERKKELDELQGFGQSLEAVDGKVDALKGIFNRQARKLTAVVCRWMGNFKEFWYRGGTGEGGNATEKEAGGWRAQAHKHEPALSVEKQALERELGGCIWAFEGVQVEYDR